jgi:hypothetical protein
MTQTSSRSRSAIFDGTVDQKRPANSGADSDHQCSSCATGSSNPSLGQTGCVHVIADGNGDLKSVPQVTTNVGSGPIPQERGGGEDPARWVDGTGGRYSAGTNRSVGGAKNCPRGHQCRGENGFGTLLRRCGYLYMMQ